MGIEQFPHPRESLETQDFKTFLAVRHIVEELRSYPSGIPFDRLVAYVQADYENWQDILLYLLDADTVYIQDDYIKIAI